MSGYMNTMCVTGGMMLVVYKRGISATHTCVVLWCAVLMIMMVMVVGVGGSHDLIIDL